MPARHLPAALTRRYHRPRLTVRARLALLYGGVFLASGAALSGATYLLVAHALPSPSTAPGSVPPQDALSQKPGAFRQPVVDKQHLIEQQRASYLHQLLVGSSIALAITTIIAVALGWLLARRVLRPLRTITNTTRGISEDNLHHRLALPGPSDELTDLGDTIDELLARLQAAFNAQKSFVANASHELRTPLTLARATLQVALADPAITLDSLRAACHDVLDAGRQQEQLIAALLTLARSQRGLDHRQPVDLAATATSVANTHEPAAAALGVRLDVTGHTAPVSGDPQLLQRLVSNLVENAIHYNHPGGTVHILTDTDTDTDTHHARLQVTNTGPQIPPEQITRLLQPFQRTNTDRVTGEHDGLGLGLPIVQAIATAHGAQLNLHPRQTGGLAIEVRFPRAPATHPANKPIHPAAGNTLHASLTSADAGSHRLPKAST
ncbi:MAG TPA: HAMP domain-containing sensor histidine kinase [Streptosporangiaceae bacterium]|nr:HAMP domain-containing sensor histidine kinase [Streptosporangiaceae bacterium]